MEPRGNNTDLRPSEKRGGASPPPLRLARCQVQNYRPVFRFPWNSEHPEFTEVNSVREQRWSSETQGCICEGGKSHTCFGLHPPHNSPATALHFLPARPALRSLTVGYAQNTLLSSQSHRSTFTLCRQVIEGMKKINKPA